ncbi:MAG: tetratricopeptide repeat protein [bacterium]
MHTNETTSLRLNAIRSVAVLGLVIAISGCGNAQNGPGLARLKRNSDTDSKTNISQSQQADVFFSLARAAEKQSNLQEAVKMYQSVLQKNPKSAEAHWRLAICLDKSGNFQKLATHYREAISLMPGNAEIFCDYGYSLALQNRWPDSEMNLKQSIAIRPELQRAHNNLAHGSKLDEARREFQLGGLSLPDSHWNVAQMLVSQSRWDEARTEFRKIKTLTPKDTEVDRQLASLDRLVNKVELARRSTKTDSEVARASADAYYLK